MSSFQMLFRPADVGLAGFRAKVYEASILIDLGAPNDKLTSALAGASAPRRRLRAALCWVWPFIRFSQLLNNFGELHYLNV